MDATSNVDAIDRALFQWGGWHLQSIKYISPVMAFSCIFTLETCYNNFMQSNKLYLNDPQVGGFYPYTR